MAKRLTEEMVIARTKISDLSKIKRLNCWGSEISDVSLLRKMPSVEVLSLSINKINSLADFQFCKRLEELYIRQNDIKDINQVIYLQNLPNLKNLWLGENPCAEVDGYRLSVIKSLPQLQKLDNIQITQDELRDAQKRGKNLIHPEDVQESEEEEEEYVTQPQQQYNRYQEYSETEYSPPRTSPRQEPENNEVEETDEYYPKEEASEEVKEFASPRQQSPPRKEAARKSFSPEPEYYVEGRRNSYERESPKQSQFNKCPNESFEDNNCDNNYREVKIVNSQSTSCIKEYSNGDKYVANQQAYRHNDAEVLSTHSHERRERYSCPAASHKPPFNRRPVTRNSNILSAVLCLVKELDYPSLEVVEMAVRCRMDELDE